MTTDKKESQATNGKRGAALCRAISTRIVELGMAQKEAARAVGISEEYFSLLLGGERWFGTVAEDKLHRIADFLNVPLISVMMLAEMIQPKDFYRSSTLESQVEAMFDVLEKDKRFIMAVPSRTEWSKTPLPVKLMCVILYQQVSGKDFLEKAELLQIKKVSPAKTVVEIPSTPPMPATTRKRAAPTSRSGTTKATKAPKQQRSAKAPRGKPKTA
jgi:transcriptional regulator with XRE-family HTH domain